MCGARVWLQAARNAWKKGPQHRPARCWKGLLGDWDTRIYWLIMDVKEDSISYALVEARVEGVFHGHAGKGYLQAEKTDFPESLACATLGTHLQVLHIGDKGLTLQLLNNYSHFTGTCHMLQQYLPIQLKYQSACSINSNLKAKMTQTFNQPMSDKIVQFNTLASPPSATPTPLETFLALSHDGVPTYQDPRYAAMFEEFGRSRVGIYDSGTLQSQLLILVSPGVIHRMVSFLEPERLLHPLATHPTITTKMSPSQLPAMNAVASISSSNLTTNGSTALLDSPNVTRVLGQPSVTFATQLTPPERPPRRVSNVDPRRPAVLRRSTVSRRWPGSIIVRLSPTTAFRHSDDETRQGKQSEDRQSAGTSTNLDSPSMRAMMQHLLAAPDYFAARDPGREDNPPPYPLPAPPEGMVLFRELDRGLPSSSLGRVTSGKRKSLVPDSEHTIEPEKLALDLGAATGDKRKADVERVTAQTGTSDALVANGLPEIPSPLSTSVNPKKRVRKRTPTVDKQPKKSMLTFILTTILYHGDAEGADDACKANSTGGAYGRGGGWRGVVGEVGAFQMNQISSMKSTSHHAAGHHHQFALSDVLTFINALLIPKGSLSPPGLQHSWRARSSEVHLAEYFNTTENPCVNITKRISAPLLRLEPQAGSTDSPHPKCRGPIAVCSIGRLPQVYRIYVTGRFLVAKDVGRTTVRVLNEYVKIEERKKMEVGGVRILYEV
ncbi:hypothetical protein DFP72DRAFT_851253 [Ephemerocybe angulata]|uniref:Uncharacterized protein n=1 Tax=Ephemerocybe angulata TaxID=980116 RepID=A0A8H6HQS7_9AGAR|nr:hypothetical protein DFP72DRAFT_851253 [Tulosesus angulatus]